MTDTDSRRRGRDQISAVIAAHGALTEAVVQATRLISAEGRGTLAQHLDRHRCELNVAIGELGLWAESFGDWARVTVETAIHPAPLGPASLPVTGSRVGADLLCARERLKARRANLLARLRSARLSLGAAGLPVDEMSGYRRVVRLWAGEAIDVVTSAHRLILAERYLRYLHRLTAGPGHEPDVSRTGVALVRRWMDDLEEADREGELLFAETCGYGDLVDRYRCDTLR
jgi:hypothetical protein